MSYIRYIYSVQTGLRPVWDQFEPWPVQTGLVTAKNRCGPVHIGSVWSFWVSKNWRTGPGPGLWPLGSKNRTRPDFQTLIEEHGHLCIFLPKFHCELNFIEFFWGAVKRYLRENCDYTFNTLKANMPLALQSIPVTIRKWEHRMIRWMEAYRGGLNAKDAQFQVREFSSRKYKSHRRIPDTLAQAMDG